MRRIGAAHVVCLGTFTGLIGLAVVVASPVPAVAIVRFFVVGLGLAILAPLSFASLAASVAPSARDVAIARMNIANYLGAILGGGLIGAAASSDQLRWAFVIPLVSVPLVLLAVRSFRDGDARSV